MWASANAEAVTGGPVENGLDDESWFNRHFSYKSHYAATKQRVMAFAKWNDHCGTKLQHTGNTAIPLRLILFVFAFVTNY